MMPNVNVVVIVFYPTRYTIHANPTSYGNYIIVAHQKKTTICNFAIILNANTVISTSILYVKVLCNNILKLEYGAISAF